MAKPSTSTKAPVSGTSVILALHARYEQAWEEYNRLDLANLDRSARDGNDAHARKLNIESAMCDNQIEIDALRCSILHQTPTTWPEALVLAAHVHTAFDLTDSCVSEERQESERKALQRGLDALVDFMFGEIGTAEQGGYQINQMEAALRYQRQARAGDVEELAA